MDSAADGPQMDSHGDNRSSLDGQNGWTAETELRFPAAPVRLATP
jgi:hypothetical protein